jgi:partner of Y14 and mago protein
MFGISIRKERRVKPGFTPAEDVGRFRPVIPGYEPPAVEAARRALASTSISSPAASSPAPIRKDSEGSWRRKSTLDSSNVPSSGGWRRSTATGEGSSSASSSVSYGGWRGREASKRDKEKTSVAQQVPDDWEQEEGSTKVAEDTTSEETRTTATSQSEGEDVKKARALNKKIRAIQSLKERQNEVGERLLPEQQAKVDSLDDMIRDLKALGVDDEGEKPALQ